MTTQSQIDRLNKEIATLRKSDAQEAEREARELARLNQALQGAQRASSTSTRDAKTREADRLRVTLARM